MMPPWGRPPRGLDARGRREWERQARDWYEHNRVQELGSDESEEDEMMLRREISGVERRRYVDSDLAGKRRTPPPHLADYAYGDSAGGDDEYYERAEGWQLAMKDKEEELVENALRRIRRAKLRGETNIDLSREELDALERNGMMQQVVGLSKQSHPSEGSSSGSKLKKKSGVFGYGTSVPKTKGPRTPDRKRSNPTIETNARGSPSGPQERMHSEFWGQPPVGYYPAPASRRAASRAEPRSHRQPSPVGSHYESDSRYYSGNDNNAPYPPSPSRSLPDDPDWAPRSRSSSSSKLYPQEPDAFTYQVGGPYLQGRRNASGPAGVSYSSVRRSIPSPPLTRKPVPSSASDPALLRRGSSGLSNEVIEISSDDAESDAGVRVDLVPETNTSIYPINPKNASASSGKLRRIRR